jgi:hypothetical protein
MFKGVVMKFKNVGFFVVFALAGFVSVGFSNTAAINGVYDNPDNFHFAVMGDRTGKEQKGVYSHIISEMNLIRPAFVLSVGDNIQGYTDDPNVVNKMWDEYDTLISALKVPFLKVPGNHDISNDMMSEIYKKRFGQMYYHKIYRNVLFLFLNSDDPSAAIPYELKMSLDKEKAALKEMAKTNGYSLQTLAAAQAYEMKNRELTGGKISDEQFAYFEKVLADANNARWTFVIMHKPMWRQSNPNANWLKLEKLLANRPYTVFAGHEHLNTYTQRNGRDYIVLSASGGGGLPTMLPGVYQHTLWVTMDGNEPLIANLLADGILEKNDIRSFGSLAIDANAVDANVSDTSKQMMDLLDKYNGKKK